MFRLRVAKYVLCTTLCDCKADDIKNMKVLLGMGMRLRMGKRKGRRTESGGKKGELVSW